MPEDTGSHECDPIINIGLSEISGSDKMGRSHALAGSKSVPKPAKLPSVTGSPSQNESLVQPEDLLEMMPDEHECYHCAMTVYRGLSDISGTDKKGKSRKPAPDEEEKVPAAIPKAYNESPIVLTASFIGTLNPKTNKSLFAGKHELLWELNAFPSISQLMKNYLSSCASVESLEILRSMLLNIKSIAQNDSKLQNSCIKVQFNDTCQKDLMFFNAYCEKPVHDEQV